MHVSSSIRYIGVNDHQLDMFEGQFNVPLGMAYNSYVILDEKIAVMDGVDKNFVEEWLDNLEDELQGRTPDYLVVHHMEPDHSAGIQAFMDRYPLAVIVSSAQAFRMMAGFFGTEYEDRRVVIKDGSVLPLGSHSLTFVGAPMVHWPEVHMSYESSEKVLFSADGFGKFGANDVIDPEGWDCEARRYYFGIVGKFGPQVQAVLKKAAALEINTICPLHGPVLKEDLGHYIGKYQIWSSYTPEDEKVYIAYTSVYGHTKEAAELLCSKLQAMGVAAKTDDLAREDIHECVENAFRYNKLVLCTTTYNTGVFPAMREFINLLTSRCYQNRTVAFMENGSWSPSAAKGMQTMLADCKGLTFVEPVVTIRSALKADSIAQIDALAAALK